MCDMFREANFSKKNLYNWAKLFKEGQNSFQDEDRPSRATVVSTPEMVDLVNALILADRGVTIVDIPEYLRISMSTAHKIVHGDFAFFFLRSVVTWFHLDNARPYTARRKVETISQFD